jgi:hypothetical protein
MLLAPLSQAAGFHYCSGKITNLVTRATIENSQVMLEGMTGSAQLGYGGSTQSEMQQRQFSMLLAAYMAGKSVSLEFDDSSLSCASNHTGVLIRNVSF